MNFSNTWTCMMCDQIVRQWNANDFNCAKISDDIDKVNSLTVIKFENACMN